MRPKSCNFIVNVIVCLLYPTSVPVSRSFPPSGRHRLRLRLQLRSCCCGWSRLCLLAPQLHCRPAGGSKQQRNAERSCAQVKRDGFSAKDKWQVDAPQAAAEQRRWIFICPATQTLAEIQSQSSHFNNQRLQQQEAATKSHLGGFSEFGSCQGSCQATSTEAASSTASASSASSATS